MSFKDVENMKKELADIQKSISLFKSQLEFLREECYTASNFLEKLSDSNFGRYKDAYKFRLNSYSLSSKPSQPIAKLIYDQEQSYMTDAVASVKKLNVNNH